MELWHAIILAIVEGITEFLPISSTGHMVLVSELLHIPQTQFVKSFEVIIQSGAILAVVVMYASWLFKNREAWGKILAAFIPTAIVGFTLYRVVKDVLLGNAWITVGALLVGGGVLIMFEKWFPSEREKIDKISDMSYKNAFLIGLFQSLSIVPGVSRAAATIIGGMLMGFKRKTAVEFSFLLAIPTMAAATGLDLLKSADTFSSNDFGVLAVGFIVAFATALIAVKWFLKYVQNNSFTAFGWYRIAVAILFALVFLR